MLNEDEKENDGIYKENKYENQCWSAQPNRDLTGKYLRVDHVYQPQDEYGIQFQGDNINYTSYHQLPHRHLSHLFLKLEGSAITGD